MYRAARLTKIVRHIDSSLYARPINGVIQIWRKGNRLDVSQGKQDDLFIVALTDNWTLNGKSVEWGIEPVIRKLREMDSWNRDVYGEFNNDRNKKQEDTKRMRRNEFRANAADARRDFAKATNDINTSTLDKKEKLKWH